jgi:uncharacterized membrane protein
MKNGKNHSPAAPPLLAGPVLFAVSAWCVLLLALRVLIAGRSWLLYLVWNLFLAWLPVCFACATWTMVEARRRLDFKAAAAALAWLVFFPNAPYLVTDLIHLQFRAPIPVWYDALVLSSFAVAGVLLGNASLFIFQKLVRQFYSGATSWAFVVAVCFAGGFGVYLGRFERWNSTDLARHPTRLLGSIWDVLLQPGQRQEPWEFTLLFGGFILGCYLLNYWLWLRIIQPHLAKARALA